MFEKINQIISAEEAKAIVPMTDDLVAIKNNRDEQLRAIIDGRDTRKVLIMGPCSADNEDAVVDYVTRLAALAAKADEFLAKVDELLSKTNYADRKSALAAANALLADVDATYPGVEQAKLTLAEQEASLAANDAFVASFVAEVDDLKNGLRVSDRYKAYAKASQLAADAQLDLTNPAAAAAMEDFNAAVAAYSQLVENTNDAIADAIGATAGAAIASQEQKPASVVSSLAQVAAGE